MPVNKYYVKELYEEQQFTAAVLRKDNEALLNNEAYRPLTFRNSKKGSLFIKMTRLLDAFLLSKKCAENSMVLFHFPLLATAYDWLHIFLKWRNIKTTAVIIDLDGIRDNDDLLLKKEIQQLKRFDYLIAHNNSMKDLILSHLPAAKVFTINIFDYPAKNTPVERTLSRSVCIAANFEKAPFVHQLNNFTGVNFYLYGQGYKDKLPDHSSNIHYKGIIEPHLLPGIAEGSFGLIWDGPSTDYCDNYLRYNTPHKLSLYLAAGLPVIVWKESAIATFVKETNTGVAIQSLEELNSLFDKISANDYAHMQSCAVEEGNKLKEGYYLKAVLKNIYAAV
ncbi:MAG: hypothetical protein QM791_02580 [Ferruginibacter sp.]